MNDAHALARLLVPALRWDRAHGFRYLDGLVDDALELGVGGFVVDGGPRDEAAALIGRLHAGSAHPILVAARAERGAGHAFEGLTELPAFAAVASVAVVDADDASGPALDVEVVRRAAKVTVREIKTLGVNWALAPVCDLDVPPGRADVGIRSAGGDPAVVGAIAAEWIDACQADAVLACAMHFPGLGQATGREALRPFAAAVDAGVASVMVAPEPMRGAPEGAMYSAASVENVLRGELHFDGLTTTVALDREASIAPASEAQAAIRALNAGCDLILAPGDLSGAAESLARALQRRELNASRVREARERLERWAGWARPNAGSEPSLDDVMWSRQLADRAVRFISGARPRIGATLEVVHVGAPRGTRPAEAARARESLDPFLDVLRAMHIDVTVSAEPTPRERAPLVVLLGPGDDGVSRDPSRVAANAANAANAALHDQARRAARAGADAGRDVAIVACCPPRDAAALTGSAPVVCAWDASRTMLQAAARALATWR